EAKLVDRMLTHQLVSPDPDEREQRPVRRGKAVRDLVEGARGEDLVLVGEGHHLLRDRKAFAERVQVTVDVLQKLDRTEVQAGANAHAAAGSVLARHRSEQAQRAGDRRLGIAEETDRDAAAGVEDYAI